MSSEDLQKDLEGQKESIDGQLDQYINFDDVRAEGISIRMGGRKMKLYVDEENDIPEVEEVRQDLRQKFNTKLYSIKEWLDEQVSGMYSSFEGYKQAVEEERQRLERARIDEETSKMPALTYDIMQSGLSVGKGSEPGSFVWLYRDFYWPKFVDGELMEVDYTKTMITPIIIEIVTRDYRILSVRVVKFYNLQKFQHYHSTGEGECWGSWSPGGSWETPKDILQTAQRASQLLTDVNTSSPGDENPPGFPHIRRLRERIKDDSEERDKLQRLTRAMEREGTMSRNVGAADSVGPRREGEREEGVTWSVD